MVSIDDVSKCTLVDTRSSFEKFPEFASTIYRNCCMRETVKLLIKNCKLTSFDALWMQSEGNTPENGEKTVGFFFTTMLQRTGRGFFFVKDFLANHNVTTLENLPHSPDPVSADFYPLPRLKSAL